jgi:DNA topoisomerase-1
MSILQLIANQRSIVQLVKEWSGNPWKGKDSKFSTKDADEDSIPYTSPEPVEPKRGHFGTKVKPGWKKIKYVDSPVSYYYDKEKKSWMWSDTKKPVDEETARRLKESGAPPGWRRVQLNADPNGKMAVLGYAVNKDGEERRQMRRSAAAEERADLAKWARLKDFMAVLPQIRKQVQKDLTSDDPQTKQLAEVLYLIDKTAFRVGGQEMEGEEEAYGATTLLTSFVSVDGDSVRFQFQQKGGKDMDKTVEDKALARILSNRIKGRGKKDPIFDVTDKQARAYLKKVSGNSELKVHDYRTYHATAIALREIKKYSYPVETEKELKKVQKEISAVAAEMLGNTPKMALDSYIAPQVWNVFKKEG